MNRDILNKLLSWKIDSNRKPIILRGARQVGKTTVIRQLGKEFKNIVEVNFEEHPEVVSFFEKNLSPDNILHNFQNYFDVEFVPGQTLLFFDEIQICPNALMSLRYFYEKKPELHVIAAGSLIDFALQEISFPVGRVIFYYLYPLSFAEYLSALGKTNLRSDLEKGKIQPEAIHNQLLTHIRDYSLIGGMPQVINEYLQSGSYSKCQDIQSSIIETFQADFPKYTKRNKIKYLSTVFNAIPSQVGRKFKYTNISNLYKSRELGEALELLELAGLAIKIHHSSSNGIPLEHEKNHKKFKVIFFDIGLANRILRLPIKDMLINKDITLIHEGALAEQLVGQELLAYSSYKEKAKLYYWHRESKSSNAEVDYVVEKDGSVIPIEVKSGLKTRMTSLNIFIKEKSPPCSICYSLGAGEPDGRIKHYAFYHIMSIFTKNI